MKKSILAAIAAFALCIGVLAGCTSTTQNQAANDSAATTTEKISVVCATFPAYDWVKQIVGDQADQYEITYLMGSGVDLHSYQPSVEDIAKINDADLFVYVGGESDEWAADAVEAASNENLRTVNMLATVGDAAVEEEIVEGMQAEAEHDHEGDADHEEDADHDHEGEEGPEYDEHVWLSLRHAQTLVNAIADELSALDPENADAITANAKAYVAELDALDGKYIQAVKDAAKDTVVFGDRFPFRYLVDAYGLKYYAAFVGCSAETEASFETVAFLAKKVDELGVGTVFVIEDSDQKIAQTVIENTQAKNQKIAVLDSLQSVLDAEAEDGKTYLNAMEDNLVALTAALA